jgi:hypothetical protein
MFVTRSRYYVSFTFNAPEQHSYEVTVSVAGQPLTPVRYQYALHFVSPTSAADDDFSVSPSVCEEHQCLDYYRTDSDTIQQQADAALPWVGLGMDYWAWADSCRRAGCLFAAGPQPGARMDGGFPNHVGLVVEAGYWHRSQYASDNNAGLAGVHLRRPYDRSWAPSDQSFEVTMYVEHVIPVCLINDTQRDAFHNSRSVNQPCPFMAGDGPGERQNRSISVWWRPCNNISNAVTDIQAGTHAGKLTPAAATQIQAGRYRSTVAVTDPGTYYITATVDPVEADAKFDPNDLPQTASMHVIVGPGQLSLPSSLLLQPRTSEWTAEKMPDHPTEMLFLPDKNSVYSAAFKQSDDPYMQNPRAGPGSPTWIQYNYSLVAKDANGQRRYGTDQMFVRVTRLMARDPATDSLPGWASSEALQSKRPFSRCYATPHLATALGGMDSDDLPQPAQACGGQNPGVEGGGSRFGTIAASSSCAAGTASNFTVRAVMEDVGDNVAWGVFKLEVWLCDLFSLRHGVHNCLQPKSNASARPTTTPPYRLRDIMITLRAPGLTENCLCFAMTVLIFM